MADFAGKYGSWSDEVGYAGDLLELIQHRPAWHARAACRTAPLEVSWFPERGEDVRPAKAICATCPVRVDCLEWASEQPSGLVGIWAGESGRDRRRHASAA